ncbi:DUF1294 domain-containing protein [Tissierella creatinophila]|uniref:DUF1294 domain-containing protein n=1 Tax=Tissierella creatinophila DSM 6911 TaxID=1123403 RepID=A0A1U7M968_TISCR|nr:DUF1294 domain-containing protein [Tissierella creatinophila]OLS03748.1 hypothetical protein TICRE_02610 [Tissierella creatinophila DSM 6911]
MIGQDIKELIYIYFVVINIVSFICFFIDKKRAQKELYRISESFLFNVSIIGGALGSLLGMKAFHHKTKKKKFVIGIPIILIFNILVIIYLEQFLIK